MDQLPSFEGSGIYVLFYTGDFPAYRPIKAKWPIYIGKASSLDSRKGIVKKTNDQYLRRRLADHAKSIRATELNLMDFFCKYLLVSELSIPVAESLLIRKFTPVWNQILCGFGNHPPGGTRNGTMMRPFWDTLHPGRTWADVCLPRPETAEDLKILVQEFFNKL